MKTISLWRSVPLSRVLCHTNKEPKKRCGRLVTNYFIVIISQLFYCINVNDTACLSTLIPSNWPFVKTPVVPEPKMSNWGHLIGNITAFRQYIHFNFSSWKHKKLWTMLRWLIFKERDVICKQCKFLFTCKRNFFGRRLCKNQHTQKGALCLNCTTFDNKST